MKKTRKKTAAVLLLVAFLTGMAGTGLTAAAVSEIGDTLVGPGKTAPRDVQAETGAQDEMENGQTDEQNQETESSFPVNDNFQEMVGTADLGALWGFFQNRETAFWEKQSQKKAGGRDFGGE